MSIKIPKKESEKLIAHAAARDAGNRAMMASGRTAWSRDDYNAAVLTYNTMTVMINKG